MTHTSTNLEKQWEKQQPRQETPTPWKTTSKIIDNRLLYTPIVVPDILKDGLLILAHDKQGQNGCRRTYASLKNKYHWKGIKKSVHQHCKVCARHNIKMQQLKNETLFITTTAHGFHSNGPNRRISPSIQQRQQICTHGSVHVNRFHILHLQGLFAYTYDPVILLGSYVCYTQQIHWINFEAFIVETSVQLVATELCATLLAAGTQTVLCCGHSVNERHSVLYGGLNSELV